MQSHTVCAGFGVRDQAAVVRRIRIYYRRWHTVSLSMASTDCVFLKLPTSRQAENWSGHGERF
ncbi:MAG: hypothetical protein O2931_09680, partial [Planctomycetota bacterium]|nr:hypothetical protein [Planctomycetota bacterium]